MDLVLVYSSGDLSVPRNSAIRFTDLTGLKRMNTVHTEIGNQNSRTFSGVFKNYLHFFQESFFIDSNSPNTAIRRISVPFKIVNAFPFPTHFPFPSHCFCLILALRIVSARYFHFCLSRFLLCKVSLPVAFNSYYLNQIE